MQQNKSADMDAAMAKLYVSESFVNSCLDAAQIHGGAVFLTERARAGDLIEGFY